MDRRWRWAGMVWAVFVVVGSARADDLLRPIRLERVDSGALARATEMVLEMLEGTPPEGDEVQPSVDCSEGRPDRDCLSGREGSTQTSQTCAGMAVVFGAGSCSVTCGDGYYACGKCGWGGFAMCTCRMNFTCDPYRP